MDIEKIMEFFYTRASDRVRTKVEISNKTHSEIYKTDPKLISRIINNRRTRVNPFLIPYAVISSEIKQEHSSENLNIGLLNQLDFNTIKEILWGTDEEIKNYLPDLFKLLWDELPDKDSKYQIDKDFILCDYVPYAENSVYYRILSNFEYNDSFFALYGKPDVDVLHNQEIFKQEAFNYLYLKCAKKFEKIFNNFCSATDSFHKIDIVLKTEFIDTVFVNLIKKNIPDESSLGLRIKTIIENDLAQSADLIIKHRMTGIIDELRKKLINAASTYALILKEIQEDMIENLKSEQ